MGERVVVGNVVFRKGEGDDASDVWDDTALIEAYDNAVSKVKSKLAERGGISDGSQDAQVVVQGQKKQKRHGRKHRKDKLKNNRQGRQAQEMQLQWKAGDHCRAVFTEDGRLYEAVIRSTNATAGTCVVRYLGYGNEEEQALADLLPSEARGKQKPAQQSDLGSEFGMETDEQDWMGSSRSPSISGHSPRAPRYPSSQPRPGFPPMDWAGYGAVPPFSAYSASMPPPPMPFIPGTMPAFPAMNLFPPPSFAIPSSSSAHNRPTPHHMHIPEVPAPPPLVGDEEELVSDKEALHSMLVSWYMSGYHTGYFQGLKQAKQHSASHPRDPRSPKDPSATTEQQKYAENCPPMPERR